MIETNGHCQQPQVGKCLEKRISLNTINDFDGLSRMVQLKNAHKLFDMIFNEKFNPNSMKMFHCTSD